MGLEDQLPDHFFKRELFYLPIKAGTGNLLGAGTLQHRDAVRLRTINFCPNEYSGVLLLRGEGFYEDEDGVVTPLERGSFFQRFPGRLHSTYPDGEGRWSEFFITLPSSLCNALMDTGFIDGINSLKSTAIDQEMIDTMISIKDFFRGKDRIEAAPILPKIMNFLYLVRQPEQECDVTPEQETGEDRFMQLFHNRLRSHASYDLEIKKLCVEHGVGYERFRKKFREKHHMSPGNYAVRYRIDEACRRMENRQMTIKEIALDLGYPDLVSFSRQFSRVKGVSPRQWLTNQTAAH